MPLECDAEVVAFSGLEDLTPGITDMECGGRDCEILLVDPLISDGSAAGRWKNSWLRNVRYWDLSSSSAARLMSYLMATINSSEIEQELIPV